MGLTQTESNIASMKQNCLENVERILECPVCYKTPGNPDNVHFCSNGHLLCDSCHKQILDKKCPTCRSEDWNSQNTLIPLMKQILLALPKNCPLSTECETQFENKNREEHVKNCQFRLVDCMNCSLKLPFNTFLKHLKEVHNAFIRKNTEGNYNEKIQLSEKHLSDKGKAIWVPTMTEFDDQTFIFVFFVEEDNFYFQMFLFGNQTLAENYLWQIKVINSDDPRHNTSFSGEVISVDMPTADKGRQNHSGTFCFAKTMVRKLWCKGQIGQKLCTDLAIIKKE